MKINSKEVEKYYDTFKPNYVGAFIFDPTSDKQIPYVQTFINGKESFLAFCNKHCQHMLYASYRPLKPSAITRNMNDVTSHEYFFIDIDEPSEVDKFESFCALQKLHPSFKVDSGRGYHYYFKTNRLELFNDAALVESLKVTSSLLRDLFIEAGVNIDSKIIDLARYSRIWGTYNHKRKKYCSLICEFPLTDEEITTNHNVIFSLTAKFRAEYNTARSRCTKCEVIDMAMRHNFEAEKPEAFINDVLLKNAACFLVENSKSENEARLLALVQTHSFNEIKGWMKKAEEKALRFNCYELRKFMKKEFPQHLNETCKKCNLENTNSILYLNDETLNFKQLKDEYRDTLKFPVNRFYKLQGTITANKGYKEVYVCGKTYVTDVVQSTEVTVDSLRAPTEETVYYIDEGFPSKREMNEEGLSEVRKIQATFFVYDFIYNSIKYRVLSEDPLDIGEIIIEGNIMELQDFNKIGENKKLEMCLNTLIVHSARSTMTKYNDWQQVFDNFNFSEKEVDDYIFYLKISEDERYIYNYPEQFKKLIKAFLFSGKKNNYPLHLAVIGPQGTGKSQLLAMLSQKFRNNYISGSNTTIKAFVPSSPSGKYNRGLLYNANLFLAVDEMFNIFLKAASENDSHDEMLRFNNTLENQNSVSATAFGEHKETLKAKTLWVANPTDRSHKNFIETLNSFPNSSLQRFLFFNQGHTFVDFVSSQQQDLIRLESDLPFNAEKFISLMSFVLENNKLKYDYMRVRTIIQNIKNICPQQLQHLYEVRLTDHHAILIFEGLLKYRILFEKDTTLSAKDSDYESFSDLWHYIINSWREDAGNQLSKNENIMLEMVPQEGILRSTLIRRVKEVTNLCEPVVEKMLKDLRSYNLIQNGNKSDYDKQIIYKVMKQQMDLADFQL